MRIFWVNIAKFEVNLHYRNCSNLFGILRRKIEFWYYHCWNSTKSMREKKKKVERENVEFRQQGYRISCAQFCCQCAWSARSEKKKKNWQTNCGNAIAEIGGNFFFCNNCGNGIVENREKKKLWEPNCGNAIAKIRESIFFFIAIVTMALPKMGGKK